MRKSLAFTLLTCAVLFALTGCNGDTWNNPSETENYLNDSSVLTSDIAVSEENDSENGSYMAQMNFVEEKISDDGSYNYVPFYDGIIYNGGELEFHIEFTFSGDRKSVKSMEAVALLFVDGYIQEFSLENSDMALTHSLIVPNDELARIRINFIPTTYDENTKKHTIIAVIMPNWTTGSDNFVRDTAVMAVGREITLNTVNVPKEDYIIEMKTREKTGWDFDHGELPFKQDGLNTNPVFHCFNQDETYCYLFCDGKLISYDEKFIFAANNQNADSVSYFGVSVNESDIGKSLYVLYIPKNYGGSEFVERTCNYLWS